MSRHSLDTSLSFSHRERRKRDDATRLIDRREARRLSLRCTGEATRSARRVILVEKIIEMHRDASRCMPRRGQIASSLPPLLSPFPSFSVSHLIFRTFALQGYRSKEDSTNRSPIYRSIERRGEERLTSSYASKATRPGCVKGIGRDRWSSSDLESKCGVGGDERERKEERKRERQKEKDGRRTTGSPSAG